MTQPIAFTARTARHGLPMLVSGQAQKELYVNEALARIDALLHTVVEGERADAPADPVAGECWIVASPAAGNWADHEDAIASWDGSLWTFIGPDTGMLIYDRSAASRRCFDGGWSTPALPDSPQGGTTVDAEARLSITALVDLLRTLKLGQ